jgi:hypothetical protein
MPPPSFSEKFLVFIAHNVPALYDVFTAAIKKLRSSFSRRKNVAEVLRGNGAQAAERLVLRNEPPRRSTYDTPPLAAGRLIFNLDSTVGFYPNFCRVCPWDASAYMYMNGFMTAASRFI